MIFAPKKILFFLIGFLQFSHAYSQASFHNFGNIQIHDQGQVGFHADVMNDGDFDKNFGFAGFYSQDDLTVSGSKRPIFFDMEIDVQNFLYLDVALGTSNFMEFVNGKVITPRDEVNVSLDYLNDAPYIGENDDRHVDGYSSISGDLNFTFPIGDDFRLRAMRIENEAAIDTAVGAYFFENPNFPNFFSESFDTENFEELLYGVSIFEFWDLNGAIPTAVTLTWDDNSNIPTLANEISDLRVVGWHRELEKWVNLGNANVSGDLNSGEITSDVILPDDYVILTFGSSNRILDGDLEVFTAVSPNGDNVNDTFVIQGLTNYPDNEVFIYNRWGVLVYQKEKYHEVQDTEKGFKGISEGRVTIAQKEELPEGTYYYVLNVQGTKNRAGYLYINR
ncbi:hypothetical protein GCM10022393_04540 [Aquimarina addita]|uniref:Gliding motility-associated C-terminal domain-containing protein n=1 Tax=Aquimarina addita TaxID=870485 RepID=A0ABP7X9T5_9FLAO